MAEGSGSVGGSNGPGNASTAGGANGAGKSTGAGEQKGVSAADKADVSKATAGVSEGEVEAQATKVAGQATTTDGFESAATAATGPASPESAAAAAKAKEDAKVEALADDLAKKSPTAAGLLSDFRAAGGTFVSSPKGSKIVGKEAPNPTIHIGPGTADDRMRSIAHELGHFDFKGDPQGAYRSPGTGMGVTDHQIEMARQHDYIVDNANAKLADEGNATLVGKTIRDEVLKSSGVDIGVSGFDVGNPLLSASGPTADRRAAIGEYFGRNLITSTTGQNYRSHYNQAFIDHYNQNFLP